MKSYSERNVFEALAVETYEQAADLVARLPSHLDGEGRELRCHEIARALAMVLGLDYVDGTSVGVDHSWLIIDRTTLLDPYVPGRLPLVQLVDIGTPTLMRLCYQGALDGARTDVRTAVVDDLVSAFDALVDTRGPDGQEAEELRAGIEKFMKDGPSVVNADGDEAWLCSDVQDELQELLDRVDARDSLHYLESADASKKHRRVDPFDADLSRMTYGDAQRYHTPTCSVWGVGPYPCSCGGVDRFLAAERRSEVD